MCTFNDCYSLEEDMGKKQISHYPATDIAMQNDPSQTHGQGKVL